MNKLAREKSPYLRHAASQSVDWNPWSDEAFERARRESKPVFLSTGAVWCHWCHVMAGESFDNGEIARMMNDLFVCIKLDRDERPDIDRRYQQSVAAMGGGSGWPLSVFLTPDRKPFFGGTYFPPEDRYGRAGFKKVLRSVSSYYHSRRREAESFADQLLEALKPDPEEPGEIRKEALNDAVQYMVRQYDSINGGFGSSPKFPMPGALEFLMQRSGAASAGDLKEIVQKTLLAMARGGLHDHLGGGFHRYSVDEGWRVPHFEKMADDNAWLLRNYLHAYASFGDHRFKEAAEGIIRFSTTVLSDPQGGFFASQDADVIAEDEGGYFTWTDEDFRTVLEDKEYEILSRYYLHPEGRMHHDPLKHALFTIRGTDKIASEAGMTPDEADMLMKRGKIKLLNARNLRKTPFIDATLYTSLNGMFIASYFLGYRVLGRAELKEFALLSLNRILQERYVKGVLYHTEGVEGLLDDYVFMVDALVAAYEATADRAHLIRAEVLARYGLEKFQDEKGGFFDTEQEVLGIRLKRIEDIPHPSPNAVFARLLFKLYHITGQEEYNRAATKTIALFSGLAHEIGIHAGAYYQALGALFSLVTLTVEAHPESELAHAARAVMPQATALTYGPDNGRVIPCRGTSCFEPINDAGALKDAVIKIQAESRAD